MTDEMMSLRTLLEKSADAGSATTHLPRLWISDILQAQVSGARRPSISLSE